MRWWTLAFAAFVAAGGCITFALHRDTGVLHFGFAAGCVLSLCAMAMSDMGNGWMGELAVKCAWGTCLLVALSERRVPNPRRPEERELTWGGWGALAMCAMYMWTGMSGLSQYALPTNPGAAFKMADVTAKHQIWDAWGVGDMQMRA